MNLTPGGHKTFSLGYCSLFGMLFLLLLLFLGLFKTWLTLETSFDKVNKAHPRLRLASKAFAGGYICVL